MASPPIMTGGNVTPWYTNQDKVKCVFGAREASEPKWWTQGIRHTPWANIGVGNDGLVGEEVAAADTPPPPADWTDEELNDSMKIDLGKLDTLHDFWAAVSGEGEAKGRGAINIQDVLDNIYFGNPTQKGQTRIYPEKDNKQKGGGAAGWMRNHVAGASVSSKLEPMGEAYFEQALRADDATSLIPSLCNTKREPGNTQGYTVSALMKEYADMQLAPNPPENGPMMQFLIDRPNIQAIDLGCPKSSTSGPSPKKELFGGKEILSGHKLAQMNYVARFIMKFFNYPDSGTPAGVGFVIDANSDPLNCIFQGQTWTHSQSGGGIRTIGTALTSADSATGGAGDKGTRGVNDAACRCQVGFLGSKKNTGQPYKCPFDARYDPYPFPFNTTDPDEVNIFLITSNIFTDMRAKWLKKQRDDNPHPHDAWQNPYVKRLYYKGKTGASFSKQHQSGIVLVVEIEVPNGAGVFTTIRAEADFSVSATPTAGVSGASVATLKGAIKAIWDARESGTPNIKIELDKFRQKGAPGGKPAWKGELDLTPILEQMLDAEMTYMDLILFLLDYKRSGDWEQVHTIGYLDANAPINPLGVHPIFCTGDRLCALYARYKRYNCIYSHHNTLSLYRTARADMTPAELEAAEAIARKATLTNSLIAFCTDVLVPMHLLSNHARAQWDNPENTASNGWDRFLDLYAGLGTSQGEAPDPPQDSLLNQLIASLCGCDAHTLERKPEQSLSLYWFVIIDLIALRTRFRSYGNKFSVQKAQINTMFAQIKDFDGTPIYDSMKTAAQNAANTLAAQTKAITTITIPWTPAEFLASIDPPVIEELQRTIDQFNAGASELGDFPRYLRDMMAAAFGTADAKKPLGVISAEESRLGIDLNKMMGISQKKLGPRTLKILEGDANSLKNISKSKIVASMGGSKFLSIDQSVPDAYNNIADSMTAMSMYDAVRLKGEETHSHQESKWKLQFEENKFDNFQKGAPIANLSSGAVTILNNVKQQLNSVPAIRPLFSQSEDDLEENAPTKVFVGDAEIQKILSVTGTLHIPEGEGGDMLLPLKYKESGEMVDYDQSKVLNHLYALADEVARADDFPVPAPAVPATAVPAPAVPAPAVPATAVPATAVPATAVPAPAVPATGEDNMLLDGGARGQQGGTVLRLKPRKPEARGDFAKRQECLKALGKYDWNILLHGVRESSRVTLPILETFISTIYPGYYVRFATENLVKLGTEYFKKSNTDAALKAAQERVRVVVDETPRTLAHQVLYPVKRELLSQTIALMSRSFANIGLPEFVVQLGIVGNSLLPGEKGSDLGKEVANFSLLASAMQLENAIFTLHWCSTVIGGTPEDFLDTFKQKMDNVGEGIDPGVTGIATLILDDVYDTLYPVGLAASRGVAGFLVQMVSPGEAWGSPDLVTGLLHLVINGIQGWVASIDFSDEDDQAKARVDIRAAQAAQDPQKLQDAVVAYAQQTNWGKSQMQAFISLFDLASRSSAVKAQTSAYALIAASVNARIVYLQKLKDEMTALSARMAALNARMAGGLADTELISELKHLMSTRIPDLLTEPVGAAEMRRVAIVDMRIGNSNNMFIGDLPALDTYKALKGLADTAVLAAKKDALTAYSTVFLGPDGNQLQPMWKALFTWLSTWSPVLIVPAHLMEVQEAKATGDMEAVSRLFRHTWTERHAELPNLPKKIERLNNYGANKKAISVDKCFAQRFRLFAGGCVSTDTSGNIGWAKFMTPIIKNDKVLEECKTSSATQIETTYSRLAETFNQYFASFLASSPPDIQQAGILTMMECVPDVLKTLQLLTNLKWSPTDPRRPYDLGSVVINHYEFAVALAREQGFATLDADQNGTISKAEWTKAGLLESEFKEALDMQKNMDMHIMDMHIEKMNRFKRSLSGDEPSEENQEAAMEEDDEEPSDDDGSPRNTRKRKIREKYHEAAAMEDDEESSDDDGSPRNTPKIKTGEEDDDGSPPNTRDEYQEPAAMEKDDKEHGLTKGGWAKWIEARAGTAFTQTACQTFMNESGNQSGDCTFSNSSEVLSFVIKAVEDIKQYDDWVWWQILVIRFFAFLDKYMVYFFDGTDPRVNSYLTLGKEAFNLATSVGQKFAQDLDRDAPNLATLREQVYTLGELHTVGNNAAYMLLGQEELTARNVQAQATAVASRNPVDAELAKQAQEQAQATMTELEVTRILAGSSELWGEIVKKLDIGGDVREEEDMATDDVEEAEDKLKKEMENLGVKEETNQKKVLERVRQYLATAGGAVHDELLKYARRVVEALEKQGMDVNKVQEGWRFAAHNLKIDNLTQKFDELQRLNSQLTKLLQLDSELEQHEVLALSAALTLDEVKQDEAKMTSNLFESFLLEFAFPYIFSAQAKRALPLNETYSSTMTNWRYWDGFKCFTELGPNVVNTLKAEYKKNAATGMGGGRRTRRKRPQARKTRRKGRKTKHKKTRFRKRPRKPTRGQKARRRTKTSKNVSFRK